MIHDVAHIGHAELLTPKPDESLRFFEQVLGMEVEAREENERVKRARLQAGALSYDLDGLRAVVEEGAGP